MNPEHKNSIKDIAITLIPAALFIVALLPRIICLLQIQHSVISQMLPMDTAEYDAWGVRISQGELVGREVFYAMPLYAYFLGFIYFLFGHHLEAVRLIQLILGAVNCVLIFYISKKIFKNLHLASLAFIIAILFKLSVFYELLLDGSTLATFIFLMFILTVVRFYEKPTLTVSLFAGLLGTLGVLTRANFLILFAIVIILAWGSFSGIVLKKKKVLLCVLFVLPLVIAISATASINYNAQKDFVPLTAHGGINFYLGNGPYANGRYPTVPFLAGGSENMIKQSVIIARQDSKKNLKPSQASSYWSVKTMEFIRSNPQKYLLLILQKIRLFVSGFEMPDVFSYSFSYKFIPALRFFPITFLLLIPLGISGMILTPSQNKAILLLKMLFIGYAVGIITFLVNERYKIPLYPILAMFAAGFMIHAFKKGVNNIKKSIAFAVFIGLILLYSDVSFARVYGVNQAASYNILGYEFLDRTDYTKAIEYFSKAVELEPQRADAYNSLGFAYMSNDKLDMAEEAFKKAIELNPNLFQAYYNLANLYFKEGKIDEGNRNMDQYKRLSPYEE